MSRPRRHGTTEPCRVVKDSRAEDQLSWSGRQYPRPERGLRPARTGGQDGRARGLRAVFSSRVAMTEALGPPDGDSGAAGAAGRAGAKAAEAPTETEALASGGSAHPRGGREGKVPTGTAELPAAQLATAGGLPRPPRRVTSWDVAREAGVSQNTVSLILKGSPRISAATRARVQGVMERLGYRPNAVAAALRSGTPRAVLFVAPRGASRFPPPTSGGGSSR